MEFGYRITEKDYVSACRMAMKSRRAGLGKTIAFWCFIVICLMLLFTVVQKQTMMPVSPNPTPAPATEQASTSHLVENLAPLVGVVAVFLILGFYGLPFALRRQYRKDTNSQGEITIALDPQSISIRSSIGTSFQAGWNAYKDWQEKKGIVLLRFPSGAFQIVNVAGLSDAEREELSGILTAALPQKK